jgi:hypothetical protein
MALGNECQGGAEAWIIAGAANGWPARVLYFGLSCAKQSVVEGKVLPSVLQRDRDFQRHVVLLGLPAGGAPKLGNQREPQEVNQDGT